MVSKQNSNQHRSKNIYTISALEEWKQTVAERMPHMSAPQATVLALWSFGMVISQSCGLTTVSSSLALLLCVKENSVRQRIREGITRKKINVEKDDVRLK